MASRIFRRREPFLLLTGIVGLFVILGYFITSPPIRAIYEQIQIMANTFFFFYLCLGLLTSYRHHVIYIQKRITTPPSWPWSIYFLVVMTATVIAAGVFGVGSVAAKWIIDYPQRGIALGSGALFAPFMYRALYKSVNIRNTGLGIMLLIIMVLLMKQAPLWNIIAPWSFPLGDWISTVPAAAAERGFDLAVAIASLVLCSRILSGLETGYLGKD
jgi:hypothetical protein